MTVEVKTCVNCGRPLAERVEDIQRTGAMGNLSTGICETFRIWFCVNPDCEMCNADVYREQIADNR